MQNFLILLVVAFGTSNTPVLAQSTETITAAASRGTLPAEASPTPTTSIARDPAWSSVWSVAHHATGVEGAAYSSYTSLLGSLSTADPNLGNSIFSEVSKVYTLLPTQLQTFQNSLGSQVWSIRATWTGTFPEGFLSKSSIISTSSVGVTTSLAIAPVMTTKVTESSSTTVTKAAASATGAAEKLVVVGCAVAIGAVGVAAALL